MGPQHLTAKSKKADASTIVRADDPSVECYYCERYNHVADGFKCKALGWFVQFAIRADLHASFSAPLAWHDPRVQLQGYPRLHSKSDDLQALIRTKHLIDESGLDTIDLSLYDFPTLSHFFAAPSFQQSVREATARDMGTHLIEMREMVENSDLSSLLPKALSHEEAIGSLTGSMTRSQIENAAKLSPEEQSGQRLLLVDMGAPLAVLKAQFLQALDRPDRQKSSVDVLYKTWRRYGILPYIDLSEWVRWNPQFRVKLPIQAELIYELDDSDDSPFLNEKTVRETTEPNANRMLDVRSQPFRALVAAASEEFAATIEQVQRESKCPKGSSAEEALLRWFPRTFPYNIPDIERAARIFPEHSASLTSLLAEIRRSGVVTLPIADRVRDYYCNSNGFAVMEFVKRIGLAPEVLFPSSADPVETQADLDDVDIAQAIAAFEKAEAAESNGKAQIG